MKRANLTEPFKILTLAIVLNSNHSNAYNNRGLAYSNKGNFERAIQDYNKAIELAPESVYAYSNRGVAYAEEGDLNVLSKTLTRDSSLARI